MEELRKQADSALAQVANEYATLLTLMAGDELAAKAARFDVFRQLGELTCKNPDGTFNVDGRTFASFEEAFDSVMEETLASVRQAQAS